MSEKTFKELENYILEKHRIAQLSEKIRSQISIFVTLKKISYKDMLLSLRYFYEEKGGVPMDGIGIIPFVIEEAKAFYKKEAQEQEKRERAFLQQQQTFRTIKRIIKPQLNEQKKSNKINIEEL